MAEIKEDNEVDNPTNETFVFKPIGWTPTQCVNKFKQDKGYKYVAFAGRLDPMACGILPLIHHPDPTERNKQQQKYQDKFKTYKFNVILGVQTDTYDILGIPRPAPIYQDINEVIKGLSEIKEQEYPPYSSKSVYSDKDKKMIQLWELAKQNNLPKELPKHPVQIEYFKLLSRTTLNGQELINTIKKRIDNLPPNSNFRQTEIMKEWLDLTNRDYIVLECEARVSSGVYIRGLANSLNGTAYDICRIGIEDIMINPDKYNKFLI